MAIVVIISGGLHKDMLKVNIEHDMNILTLRFACNKLSKTTKLMT